MGGELGIVCEDYERTTKKRFFKITIDQRCDRSYYEEEPDSSDFGLQTSDFRLLAATITMFSRISKYIVTYKFLFQREIQ